jgi:uncharacterized protein YeaO (DUF488 family)
MLKTEKTIYDPPQRSDGERVLVMKIWPRGVSKNKVHAWLKELGTDPELIKKWKAGKVSWAEFSQEYKKSLKGKKELLHELALKSQKKTITLLCSCKDERHCHRHLLKKAIEKAL